MALFLIGYICERRIKSIINIIHIERHRKIYILTVDY